MVHFYGKSQACISLVCRAKSARQEETDGFSIIDANELPGVAGLRIAIKSKSQSAGFVSVCVCVSEHAPPHPTPH